MTSLPVTLVRDALRIGDRLSVSFQRTLRIPDDGRTYPLPPGLGRFPVRRCADYADVLPRAWRNDLFIPMYKREALWIAFDGAHWKPNAVKIGVGLVDAISGRAWTDALEPDPQNYLVVPGQPWLDGINAGDGWIRQFVAMPLGEGVTVEAQITGREHHGGLQLMAFEPKPGRFPDEPPPMEKMALGTGIAAAAAMPAQMGMGAGGRMRQKIYPDRHGVDTWDTEQRADVFIHLFPADVFAGVTGERMPPSPVDAAAYTRAKLPWFDLYDEAESDVAAAEALARVKSIRDMEARAPDARVDVDEAQIRKLRRT